MGYLSFMVETSAGPNIVFRQVQQIQIADMHYQAHGYFGFIGIGNVGNQVFPKPLQVSYLLNIANTPQ